MSLKSFIDNYLIKLVCAGYVFFRVFNASKVQPLFDAYDAPEYFKFNFFPSFRTHGITLVYYVLKNEWYITIFQATIGSLGWIYLMYSVMSLIKNKYLKYCFIIFYLSLAVSSVILEWDSNLGSESMAITSTIFVFSAAINFSVGKKAKSFSSMLILGLGILWFLSTKSSNSLLFPLIGFIYLLSLKSNKISKYIFTVGLIFTSIGTFLFINSLSSDISKTLNTSAVINNRLVYFNDWKNQVLDSGYPITALSVWQEFNENNLGKPPDQAVIDLPEFKFWWENGGESYLINFTLSNLDYAFISPFALPIFSEQFNYKKTLLSGWSQGTDLNSDYVNFKKSILIRTFYWPDEPEKSYLALSITFFVIGISLLTLIRLGNLNEANLLLISFLLIVFLSYINWWFGSKPNDMARHNLIAAIMFRVLAVVSISMALDSLVKRVRKL
jgi:hypothetical protein